MSRSYGLNAASSRGRFSGRLAYRSASCPSRSPEGGRRNASARLRIREGVRLRAEARRRTVGEFAGSLSRKRGCGLDYPHNVQLQIPPLPNAQEIDELPPGGNENVDLEGPRVEPPHDVSNVRLGSADARCMAVEADPDPRRAVGAAVSAGHSGVLISGHDVKSPVPAGCIE